MFHIHSLGRGGAERVVVTLATEMVKKGIQVWIATTATFENEYPLPEGVERLHVGTTPGEESLPERKKRALRKDRLHAALLEKKPEVLYSLCRGANYRAALAAKGTGVPVIISVRNDPKVDYGSRKQKILSTLIYREAAGAVFQTEEAMHFFTDLEKRGARVIMNPVNPVFAGIEPVSEARRRKAFVAVGRFHEQKDYMTLVKAYEIVHEAHPEYPLEIYGGKGEDNSLYQVKEWVRSHRLEKQIIFMGQKENVAEFIKDASVYVLSSRYEGMPNALMEAMALGLPVVSTDCPCGGPALLIEDGVNGLLAEPGNFRELAAAMNKMVEYPQEAARVGNEALKIRERASVSNITEQWLSYGEEVIKARKK